ncbi:MAG: hypothetical protein JOZ51_24125 [Chloroflexi bacterium]|nr:hypothetical protein [Chloroflexota bacterium]
MFAKIRANRAKTLLVLGMLLVGFGLPLRPIAAVHLSSVTDASRDWRQALEGRWDCQGTSTLGMRGVEPYAGRLKNELARDGSWLMIEFVEQRSEGTPFRERQLWEVLADGTQRRTIITDTGTGGILTSPRLRGNASKWEGPFGEAFLSEKLTLRSPNQHHWRGELTQDGQYAGYYELTCTRLLSH